MKYLYPYECEKRGLSNPNELQAAIDSNRREGRRQSFGGSLFAYSPGGAHGMLSSPKLPVPSLGLAASTNGSSITPAPKIKKGKGRPGPLPWRGRGDAGTLPSLRVPGRPLPALAPGGALCPPQTGPVNPAAPAPPLPEGPTRPRLRPRPRTASCCVPPSARRAAGAVTARCGPSH